jgi:hypothetical protein
VVTCPTCRTENPEGAAFCRKCGAYLRWDDHPTVGAVAPAAISIQLAADAVSVAPGTEGGCDVWLRNGSNQLVRIALELYESAGAWSIVEPASLEVAPAGQARAHIRILPPSAGGSTVQGPQRLGVRATPDGNAAGAVAAEAVVAVTGVVDFSLEIDPPTSKATHFAVRDVRITNGGNAPVAVTLSASEESGELSFEFDHGRVTVAPAESGQTKLTVLVRRPRRFGRTIEREFSVAGVADRGPTRQATATVETTPSVGTALALLLILVLVLGLAALGLAAIGGDDDSQYSCPEIALPQGATSQPAHFEGGNDSLAVHTENGFAYVTALLDGTRGATAQYGLPVGTIPIGGADVDGDGIDEGWILEDSGNPVVLAILTFKPPCDLKFVATTGPLAIRKGTTGGVECRDESGAGVVRSVEGEEGSRDSRLFRLHDSKLAEAPFNSRLVPARPGFHCGSLSRGWK